MRALNAIAYHEGKTRFELEETQSIPGISENGISEAFPLEGTRSLYGTTKLCSELLIQEYGEMYGLNTVINRCGVIAGPWQMGKADQGVAALWMARHLFGGNLAYIGYGGAGKQVRDFLHVDDLAGLVTLEIQKIEALTGSVFNAGGGRKRSASLQELTNACAEISGNRIEIASKSENRAADVPIYITDNDAITQTTGWKPEKDLSDILRDTYQWMTEYKEQLRSILAG
jgi:CDP-paratose 2-epimerase